MAGVSAQQAVFSRRVGRARQVNVQGQKCGVSAALVGGNGVRTSDENFAEEEITNQPPIRRRRAVLLVRQMRYAGCRHALFQKGKRQAL